MNMLTRQHQIDAPQSASLPVERMVVHQYGEQRAGRAFVELQNANVALAPFSNDLPLMLLWSRAMWARVCERSLAEPQDREWVDDEYFALAVGDWMTDTAPVVAEDDDAADADLVRWFAEGQSEAEESLRTGRFDAQDDPEARGEPIRMLGARLRSESWRGGGTMHRR